MPLKLNVGLSRKVGEARYGSRGASVNVEVEVESLLVRQPQQLQKKLRYLFRLAQQAVDEQLSRSERPATATAAAAPSNGRCAEPTGRSSERSSELRSATPGQLRAIRALVEQQDRNLQATLSERFSVQRVEDLTVRQASRLIDDLKSLPANCPGEAP